jgi:hypothetical protein
MCAQTVYAARTQELRNHIAKFNKDTPFQVIYGKVCRVYQFASTDCPLRRTVRV